MSASPRVDGPVLRFSYPARAQNRIDRGRDEIAGTLFHEDVRDEWGVQIVADYPGTSQAMRG